MSMFDNCTGSGEYLVTYLAALAVHLQQIQRGVAPLEQAVADFRGSMLGNTQTCRRVEGQLEELQQTLEAYAGRLTGKGEEPVPIVMLYLKYPLLTPLYCAKESIEKALRHLAVYASCCTQMTVAALEQRNAIYKQIQSIQKEMAELSEQCDGFEEQALLEHRRLALSIGCLPTSPERI